MGHSSRRSGRVPARAGCVALPGPLGGRDCFPSQVNAGGLVHLSDVEPIGSKYAPPQKRVACLDEHLDKSCADRSAALPGKERGCFRVEDYSRAGQEGGVCRAIGDIATNANGEDIVEARQTEWRQVYTNEVPFLVGGGAAALVALKSGLFVLLEHALERLLTQKRRADIFYKLEVRAREGSPAHSREGNRLHH